MVKRWIVLAGVAIIGMAALWFFFLRSDNPDPVSLSDAVEAATDPTVVSETTLPEEAVDAGLDGTWTVLADDATFAGYRVGEELVGIGVTEAVGRTSDVTGSLELEGSTLTAVGIEVDMSSLRSDDNRRDGAMRQRALETGAFPTASFLLTQPIELGSVPTEGVSVTVTAIGDLTLHGATRPIEIPLEAQLVGNRIVVVGSVDVTYGDFGIDLPSAPVLVGVEDHGLIELQLTFSRP